MKRLHQISLRLRLALMFSAVSAILLGVMGICLYSALKK